MEKEIEGYVSKTLFKLFGEGKNHHLSFLREPLMGIDVHVTLSPACPERSPQGEPDYEAMWKDFREEWGMNEPLDENVQAMTCELKRQMDRIEAKHTPQGEVKKEKT